MQYLITTFDNGNVDWSLHSQLLKDEAKHILDLYQEGIIRNTWFSENKDALLIIENETIEQAKEAVNAFPLVKANLIKFNITCLLPYTGFERLINGTSKCN
jgi:hypothetical protein